MTRITEAQVEAADEAACKANDSFAYTHTADQRRTILRAALEAAAPLAPPDAAVLAEREEIARLIQPASPRPCDCDHCLCGNIGDACDAARWDAATDFAETIRARSAAPRTEGGR